MSKKINKTRSLFLFTDGSSKRISGINHIASSYIIIDPNHKDPIIYQGSSYESNSKSLNDQSEMEAVFQGLERIDTLRRLKKIKLVKHQVRVYVITDADYVRKTFTQYVYGFIKRGSLDGEWKTSAGKVIAHQKLVKHIFFNYVNNKKNYNIKFFHINSHIKPSKLQSTHIKFNKKNKCNISLEKFKVLIKYNEQCDKLAGKTMNDGINMNVLEFANNQLTIDKQVKSVHINNIHYRNQPNINK